MAAYPFGGHPTFSAYLAWAAEKASCKVQSGYKIAKSGEALSLTRIIAPSGKHVVVVDYAQDERLTPTSIAYLDRRLGLTSPWAFPDKDSDK